MSEEWNFILCVDREDFKEEPVQYPQGMSSLDFHAGSSGRCQVCRTCFDRGIDSAEDHPRLSSSPRPRLRSMSPSGEGNFES